MYIVNPDTNMFEEWYSCSKFLGEYLIKKCGIPVLHIDKFHIHYFAQTENLVNALKKLPLLYKIFK